MNETTPLAERKYGMGENHWLYQQNLDGYSAAMNAPESDRHLAVELAARHAIRAATNSGRILDFDPDAMAQEIVHAVCGYSTRTPGTRDAAKAVPTAEATEANSAISPAEAAAHKRQCQHPDFYQCLYQGGSFPFTFVFERPEWKEPTADQIAKYRRDEVIVTSHGGTMAVQEFMCAGHNTPFNDASIDSCIYAVLRANPDLHFVDTWNGRGLYSLSVACKLKHSA